MSFQLGREKYRLFQLTQNQLLSHVKLKDELL